MALNGQASQLGLGGSSALQILVRGTQISGTICADAFTQSNPPIVTTAGTVSSKVNTRTFGVLGGSVAFSRPDQGEFVGGPVLGLAVTVQRYVRPVGVFLVDAAGPAFSNTPALSSGINVYTTGQGTFANGLYETQALATTGAVTQGDALTYVAGQELIASRNGYLMPRLVPVGVANVSIDVSGLSFEVAGGATAGTSTTIGVLTGVPDSTQSALVYDQRL